MNGHVTTPVGAGSTATVFFPSVLPSPPFVFFWSGGSSTLMALPFLQESWAYGEVASVTVYNDRAVFSNTLGSRFFQYIVASRGIP